MTEQSDNTTKDFDGRVNMTLVAPVAGLGMATRLAAADAAGDGGAAVGMHGLVMSLT